MRARGLSVSTGWAKSAGLVEERERVLALGLGGEASERVLRAICAPIQRDEIGKVDSNGGNMRWVIKRAKGLTWRRAKVRIAAASSSLEADN